ncbi:hypothetical protein BGE01nite_18750 [Brevifollis gellanilyticus]|uniref:Uncharacterized protein n=1 Tax=Brevifollis gellanilyticus TaxID=748831 RepID=A0A512M793_9BACT|nr:hypothetical protein BGE01nite_18750 [Brevifollis gellanilyticus]
MVWADLGPLDSHNIRKSREIESLSSKSDTIQGECLADSAAIGTGAGERDIHCTAAIELCKFD